MNTEIKQHEEQIGVDRLLEVAGIVKDLIDELEADPLEEPCQELRDTLASLCAYARMLSASDLQDFLKSEIALADHVMDGYWAAGCD